jgi:hypothetical protein
VRYSQADLDFLSTTDVEGGSRLRLRIDDAQSEVPEWERRERKEWEEDRR